MVLREEGEVEEGEVDVVGVVREEVEMVERVLEGGEDG